MTLINNPPHRCPGGCGADVPHHLLACRSCWYLLPTVLRARVANGDKSTKLTAISEALTWYKHNTAGGVPL